MTIAMSIRWLAGVSLVTTLHAQDSDMEAAIVRTLSPLVGQVEPYCGTAATPQMVVELQQRIARGAYAQPVQSAATFTGTIPLAFHVVRNSFGTGGYTGNTFSLVNSVNAAFAGSGLTFCEQGVVDYVDNTLLQTVNELVEADQLRGLNVVPHAINVYIVDDMFVGGFQLAGLSSFTFSPVQGIIIDKDFTPQFGAPSTWPHEVGHYFDLFHTDEAFMTPIECTSGANCATAGDLVCDTPADPGLAGIVSPAPVCALQGGPIIGPCFGDGIYTPDVRNYLGFAPQTCRDHFTPGQKARAFATFVNLRPELQLGGCIHDPIELLAFTPVANDHFGSAIDLAEVNGLNNSAMVVGAKDADPKGNGSGAAYVFEQISGSGWFQDETLIPAALTAGEALGSAVAFDGFTAFLGAPGAQTNRGAVYVFERQGQFWGEKQKLTLAGPVAGDRFGNAVDVYGDWAIVGASKDDFSAGSATIYKRDPTTTVWSPAVKLVSSDVTQTGEFGSSVSISGARVAVGAHLAVGSAGTSGAVFVFDYNGATWTQTARLVPPTLSALDDFGASVSLYGDTLLVGAPLDDNPGTDAGSAHVFVFTGGTWQYRQQISAPQPFANDHFGSSVSLAGNTAIVGAPDADPSGSGSGSAFRYSRTSFGWILGEVLQPTTPAAGDSFGTAVAVEHRADMLQDDLAVGAPFHNTTLSDVGAAYAYQAISDLPGLSLTANVNQISLSAGGTQVLTCSAGPLQAGKPYRVVGSLSGTSPGVVLGGLTTVPSILFVSRHAMFTLQLNADRYLRTTLTNPNPPAPLFNSVGFLDVNGQATVTFTLPPGSHFLPAGSVIQHALLLTNDPFFASTNATLTLAP